MTWNTETMEAAKASMKMKAAASIRNIARRPRSFAAKHRRSRPVRQYTLQIRSSSSTHGRGSSRRSTREFSPVDTAHAQQDQIAEEDDNAVATAKAVPACVRHSIRIRNTGEKNHRATEDASPPPNVSIQLPPLYHRRAARNKKRVIVTGRKRPRKIVVIGDMFCGKSSLISAYCRDKFSADLYVPTILNSCLADARIFGRRVDLAIVEISGRRDYARLRQCAYHKTDAIILCYATDNSDTLESILTYWLPELQHFAPRAPRILVGTKNDRRDDRIHEARQLTDTTSEEQNVQRQALLEKLVSKARVVEAGEMVKAHASLVCSALYRDRTRDVFEKAAEVALKKSRRKKKVQGTTGTCTIL